jgi:hypothetical protein
MKNSETKSELFVIGVRVSINIGKEIDGFTSSNILRLDRL